MWPFDLAALPPIGMGCMRLSTAPDRDEARAIGALHAALDAGITVLDTAAAYGWDANDAGHNERLIASALATWNGDRGFTRPTRERRSPRACGRSPR